MSTLVGIISDTHGIMRRDALEALEGCKVILHAGDVGSPAVLDALGEIAPVHAVRGNVDTEPWAKILPLTMIVKVQGVRFQIVHRIADLKLAADVQCVVTGHSHVVKQSTADDVLYLNPGSAGPRRFRLPITLMRVLAEGKVITPEVITLG